MKSGLVWGAAVAAMAWSGSAAAQLPPSAGSKGSGGAASAPTPPAAPPPAPPTATTPPTAPTAAPTAPAPAAEQGAPPAGDTTAPAPTAPAVPDAASAPDSEADEVEEAPRKKKRRKAKRRRYVEEVEAEGDIDHEQEDEGRRDDEGEPETPVTAASRWRLGGPHFVLGAERLTSILSWNETTNVAVITQSGQPTGQKVEVTTSGVDVSLLGAGGFPRNFFSAPRVSFDYVFRGGFSLGGSVGYMASSAELEQAASEGSPARTRKEPTLTLAVFAPRLGFFIPTSARVAVWLRGGISHVVATSESEFTSDDVTLTSKTSAAVTNLALDPQLVFSPVPHVGITVGLALDIGLSGTAESESSGTTVEQDVTASSYGVTSGLVAMF